MDVLTVAAVLSLLSVSAAKPMNCEDFIKPVVLNKTEISGEWIFIQGTSDEDKYTAVLKTLNSYLMDIAPSSDNDTCVIKRKIMLNGKCRYPVHSMAFINDTFRSLDENGTMTITILPAYPDSLVLSFNSVHDGEVTRSLKIFGRTRKLSNSSLEMFQKQVECLGAPQPIFIYDEKQDMCPDEDKPTSTEEVKHDHK